MVIKFILTIRKFGDKILRPISENKTSLNTTHRLYVTLCFLNIFNRRFWLAATSAVFAIGGSSQPWSDHPDREPGISTVYPNNHLRNRFKGSRDTSVGTATLLLTWSTEEIGFHSWKKQEILLLSILSHIMCDYRRCLDWWMDLLMTHRDDSELQAIKATPLISTINKSPQHSLSLFQPPVFISRSLATVSNSGVSSASSNSRLATVSQLTLLTDLVHCV
jgi:hypothetical protein